MKGRMKRNGFTMIEILIVVAITALLSGLAITYTHVGQNQVALSVESAKIAQLLLQAKELSIATYSDKQDTCGYGVHFDYGTERYSLFEFDIPTSSPAGTFCPSIASATAPNYMTSSGHLVENEYAGGSWNVAPAQGVTLVGGGGVASGTIDDVVFFPPDPSTLISFDGKRFYGSTPPGGTDGNIYLETTDGSAARVINVSFAGQVNL